MNKYFIAFLCYALNCSFVHAAVLKVTNMTNYPLVVQRRSSKEKEKFRIEEQKMIGPMSTVKLDSGAHEIKLLTFLAPKEQVVNLIEKIAESNKNINAKKIIGKIQGQKLFESAQQLQQQFAMPESWAEIAMFNPKIKSIDTQSEVIFGAPGRIFLNTPKSLVIFEIVLLSFASTVAAWFAIMGLVAGGALIAKGAGLLAPAASAATSLTAEEIAIIAKEGLIEISEEEALNIFPQLAINLAAS